MGYNSVAEITGLSSFV